MKRFYDLTKENSHIERIKELCEMAAMSGKITEEKFLGSKWVVNYMTSEGEFSEIFSSPDDAGEFMAFLTKEEKATLISMREIVK